MIIYGNTAREFKSDVEDNRIVDRIESAFEQHLGYLPGLSERRSWVNSMQFMERIVRRAAIPDDCGIMIEFKIPSTNKRIDFMITGQDSKSQDHFVIIELKQWEKAEATALDGVVSTYTGSRHQDVAHPSYQAWSYMQFFNDMNAAIQSHEIIGKACAYLHNYARKTPEPLLLSQYQEVLEDAPVFFKEDQASLQKFLFDQVARGNGINTMYLIENSRLKPSRKLMEHVSTLFDGNDAFVLLDEQKVVFETILKKSLLATRKTVILVKGGPGTGKSVLSINLFGKLLRNGKNVRFVAPNTAFREVMLRHLTAGRIRSVARTGNMFSGSSSYWGMPTNAYDILVVDEAHRLKRKGAFMYKGENQVEDVIQAARVSIFFIDDRQQIRPDDVGSTAEIEKFADKYQAEILEMELSTQFRCAGAEGFLNWIDDVLQIQETGNYNGWDQDAFEFNILKSPHDVFTKVFEHQENELKARMLAGYAWEWTPETKNPCGEYKDVTIPEHDFAMPWNQRKKSALWAVLPEGVGQIGCVHTSQGLEFDYVGLIIGSDLRFDKESQKVYADSASYKDKTGKKGLSQEPEELTRLIKNIYRILFSRGMKGCYVYICDPDLRAYMKARLHAAKRESNQ